MTWPFLPKMMSVPIGRGRNGTGWAGSETYASNPGSPSGAAGGGSNASRPPGAGVERARARSAGRPVVVGLPGVLPGAEDPRLRDGRAVLVLVLEVVGEQRGHDLLAELAGRGAAERDRPQAVAVAPHPAAVVPRADDQGVQAVAVLLLEGLVDPERAVEILLVPPAGDVQRRHAGAAQTRGDGLLAPEAVVVGVLDEVVPGRHLAVEVAGVDVRQRPEVEEPLVEVVAVVVERRELLGPLHHRQVLEHRS